MVHFFGTEYRSHTSCISEAQKYQGHLYKEKDKKTPKGDKRRSVNGNSQAMVPKGAYVEDAPDGDETNAVAVVDVPPRAPTPPPPMSALPDGVNVFDYLVSEPTPSSGRKELASAAQPRTIDVEAHYANGDSQYSQYSNGDGTRYLQHGFSYGGAPVPPTFERYDSWPNLTDSQQSHQLMPPPPPYVTPAPNRHDKAGSKEKHKSDKSDKKRKRQPIEDLDLSSTKRPSSRGDAMMPDAPRTGPANRVLHSGLTGGLTRLVTDPEFYEDRIEAGPTPISPLKRTRRDKDVKDERRKSTYSAYSTTTKASSSRQSDDKHHPHSHSRDRESEASKPRRYQHRDSLSSDDRQRPNTSRKDPKPLDPSTRTTSVQPHDANRLATSSSTSRAELFLSFINKGPDSERGCSLNKALKRYHREREAVRSEEKEEEDKELWKALRMRRNERGEIVLFV